MAVKNSLLVGEAKNGAAGSTSRLVVNSSYEPNGEHGTYHLADNPTIYQPIRQNNFRFIAHGLHDMLYAGGSTDVISGAQGQEILDFSVVSFSAPTFKQDVIPIKRGNSTVFYAGVPTFSNNPNSLKINDFVGADGKSVLMAWQNLSYNVIEDTIPSSDKYKINATVYEYLPDNRLIRYWELYGCWVAGISIDDFNAESGGKKTVTASIQYDKAVPHMDDEWSPVSRLTD